MIEASSAAVAIDKRELMISNKYNGISNSSQFCSVAVVYFYFVFAASSLVEVKGGRHEKNLNCTPQSEPFNVSESFAECSFSLEFLEQCSAS